MTKTDDIAGLQSRLGYQFNDPALLRLALTHRSLGANNNERLEFLGDSLLNWCVTRYLYEQLPDVREGQMSRFRARLVKGETLAEIARELHLQPCLLLSEGELKTGGRERASILADTVEALIGAIYLDAGQDSAESAIRRWLGSRMSNPKLQGSGKDPKSELQELMQSRQLPLPVYEVERIEGEGHAQVFYVSCRVDALSGAPTASASSRKKAEKLAAAMVLEKLEAQQ